MPTLPRILLVGGPDIDARLELMHYLKGAFKVDALGSSPTLADRFSAEGFSYSSYRLNRGTNPAMDLFTLSQLVSIYRKSSPQIVHTFDTKPCVWGRLAARLAGVPIIIGTLPGLGALYASDAFATRLTRSLYQPLQKLACHLSDLTIFQNQVDARQFIATGVVSESKAMIIPGSGVSTTLFASAQVPESERVWLKRELNIRLGEMVVTMVSRLIRSKGILDFAAAARDLGKRHPEARCFLIGPEDGNSIDRLSTQELARLRETVTWLGPRQDIRSLLSISDLFVLPSTYREGIPRVLLEAASMGLPIVTTNFPGCNEVVTNDVNGFLVPVRDPAALTQAMTLLIQHPELRQRFGQASRRRAVERFDLSVVAEKTRLTYQNLLAGGMPKPAVETR